jgi:hypothetical protein
LAFTGSRVKENPHPHSPSGEKEKKKKKEKKRKKKLQKQAPGVARFHASPARSYKSIY